MLVRVTSSVRVECPASPSSWPGNHDMSCIIFFMEVDRTVAGVLTEAPSPVSRGALMARTNPGKADGRTE